MSRYDLNSLEGCTAFVMGESPAKIATQILDDQRRCRDGGVPSLVVHCLPKRTDGISRAITESPDVPMAVARMRLASIVSVIKAHLANLTPPEASAIPKHLVPTDAEYETALKVLQYLQLPSVALCSAPTTPLSTIVETIQGQLRRGAGLRTALGQDQTSRRQCYICHFVILSPHRFYPSLCNPCGEFNIASSSLSLPPNLNLAGKTALVTGGRVNLGYHTSLRLLRCGARVIVSSRYPLDTETRYASEHDFDNWKDRLKVVGADFRSAKDVFALVHAVLDILRRWDTSAADGPTSAQLDILINNAAQTLTDSVDKEGESIQREAGLHSNVQGLIEGNYSARVRGGVTGYHLQAAPSSQVSVSETTTNTSLISLTKTRSSWVQKISEIPYEDVISAHSVNTFVPFILLRELLPYMGSRRSSTSPTSTSTPPPDTSTNPTSKPYHPTPPAAYIINISSREGLFENHPSHASKSGHHVHTNMSKAALNMLTETEASSAWKNGRVAMNTVDPGYMSADAEFMKMVGKEGESCPIGWEDGAGRVLWPIAKGEKGEVVRGRFLKHFRAVEAVRY